MILEQFLELIEEDKNIVDDIEEINIIFKEELEHNFMLKKNNFKSLFNKNLKYKWNKKTRTLRMKK
tara:strand:- start:9 stop:206 length:198 start_codon:yes stop_codon:yes gene_type:complete